MGFYLGILLLLAALFLTPVLKGYWRRHRIAVETGHPADSVRAKRARAPRPAKRTNYRAVSVLPCENACAAAHAFADRVLTEDAPNLPLDTCDRIRDCSCRYEQHADRRAGEDRRATFGSLSKVGQLGHQGINYRSGLDRRAGGDSEFDDIEYE